MEIFLLEIAKKGLYMVLLLSAPPIITAMVVGLIVSIIQATTQIQEQTLTFVPKLFAIIFILIFFGANGMQFMIQYATEILTVFPEQLG